VRGRVASLVNRVIEKEKRNRMWRKDFFRLFEKEFPPWFPYWGFVALRIVIGLLIVVTVWKALT
jgi:hypothetical protein